MSRCTLPRLVFLLCVACGTLWCEAEDNPASGQSGFTPASPSHFLTNAVQFRELSVNDYLNECAFHLTGVHSVNSNGTLTVMGKPGPISLWIGQMPSNHLSRLVDAKLRARGVLSLAAPHQFDG